MTALHQHNNAPTHLEPPNIPSEPEILSLKTFLELFSEQIQKGLEREGFRFAWDVWWLEVDRRVVVLVQCGHGCPPRPSLEPSGSFDFWF